jgi:polo-like kinase 1
VKKWVDYSSKYGLGYLLSNGATGVFFNDSTKILLDQTNLTTFYYYERKAISVTEKQDVMQVHEITNYPKELHKKVTLMQHFRSYLETHEDSEEGNAGQLPSTAANIPPPINSGNGGDKNLQVNPHVYVKKWMRTKHAIMFRLSNKIVQVNF